MDGFDRIDDVFSQQKFGKSCSVHGERREKINISLEKLKNIQIGVELKMSLENWKYYLTKCVNGSSEHFSTWHIYNVSARQMFYVAH